MATKAKTKKTQKSTYEVIKNTTKKINTGIYNTSSEIVEGTLETGEQWQALLSKSLKEGTKLMKKQQDFMIDTLEAVKNQYDVDTDRYSKLFGLDKIADRRKDLLKSIKSISPKWTARIEKTVDMVTKTTTEAVEKVTDAADKVMDAVEEKAEDAVKAAKKVSKKVSKTADKVMDAVEERAEEAVKAAKKAVKAEKVTDIPLGTDLKVISGIGPKMEEILKANGITNITQLKNAKAADLRKVLDKAGSRYKMLNPQLWIDAAKKA